MQPEPSADGVLHARDEPVAFARAAVMMAQTLVAVAVIGIAVGLVVLVSYSVQLHAFPTFDSDEWLPQLLSIGFWCGLVVAFLAGVPLLDRLALNGLERCPATPPLTQSGLRLWTWGLHACLGLILLACVALVTSPFMQGLVLVLLCLSGAMLSVFIEWRWGASLPQRGTGRVDLVFLLFGAHIFNQMLLLFVWVLVLDRTRSSGLSEWLIAGAVVMVLGLLRTVIAAVRLSPATILGISTMALVVVGGMLSPQIVRMAMLANLPNARLHLERTTACELARHLVLTQEEVVLECAKPMSTTMLTHLSIDVDVVSRIGGQYLLSWPGALAHSPNAACDHVHSVRSPRLGPDARKLRCVEIPRSAVRTTMR